MAINQFGFTTTTTAQQVLTVPVATAQVKVWLQNADATNAIYIGAKGVTTSGKTIGFKLPAGASVEWTLDGGDTVYAIAAAGSPLLSCTWTRN